MARDQTVTVLVCDDQAERADDIVAQISGAGVPTPIKLVGKALTVELERLFANVARCLSDPQNYQPSGALAFDEADILILDNNLALLPVAGARLTAESIAGYLRAFTTAGYIVSLNKNTEVEFDLRYLVGDYATRADLALNNVHLDNRALWTGRLADAKNGFLPWYWPALNEVGARRRSQSRFVQTNLNSQILATFAFPAEAIELLSRHATGALSPIARSMTTSDSEGVRIDDLRFIDLFRFSGRSLPDIRERDALREAVQSGHPRIAEVVSRVVAADIDLWFRRDIVGPQEILVDVPHLLVRMPFLLGEHASGLAGWTATRDIPAAPHGMLQELFGDFLAPVQFQHPDWVRSPCFWWPSLKNSEKLNELFATGTDWADVVFCEDTSTFEDRAGDPELAPAEFVAEFEGPWDRRHVRRLQSIKYAPLSRFAI